MFIICDSANVVQDKASIEANLNRGYAFPGHTVHEVPNTLDVRIGDSYNGDLIINKELRINRSLRSIKMEMVNVALKKDKAAELRYDDIAIEFTTEYTNLETEKEKLYAELIIAINEN